MAITLVIKDANFSENKLDTVEFEDIVPCTGISLDDDSIALALIGGTQQLTATLTPADTTDQVVWSSSNPGVATVENGLVTAVSLGEATITATCGNQTATCAVDVNHVSPSYVAVNGYCPYRRSSVGSAATTNKYSGSATTSNQYIVAADQAIGLYPIESKDVDTSPYRFVPILIPAGATKIKISYPDGTFYTRVLFFDSSKKETVANTGAYCVAGKTDGSFDQQSSVASPVEIDIPSNVQGLDSFCTAIAGGGSAITRDIWENYASIIGVEFLHDAS